MNSDSKRSTEHLKSYQFKEGHKVNQVYDEPMTERVNVKMPPT